MCVGECKLRFEKENPVTHSEMSQLVSGKLKHLRQLMDTKGDTWQLRGFFFANADYSEDARYLAHREDIRIFRVKMSHGWKRKDIWKVRFEELEN